jgi:predicted regulator of Ras-like GTPase activity (Roadblock/LC7/MglB family)
MREAGQAAGEESGPAGPIADELAMLRANVPGVRGGITATSDGLLLAHDADGLEPAQVAALVAATHAVAVRASLSTGCGQLREVITRGSDGYLAVYAAGDAAIVAVMGTSDLNVAMLNFRARKMIERVAAHAAGIRRLPPQGVAVPRQRHPGRQGPGEEGRAPGQLPARRTPPPPRSGQPG